MLSAEEILCDTQQVIAGLEALRGENRGLLESLQQPEESRMTSESSSVEQEKCGILRQSLERIELGLSEAQVQTWVRENEKEFLLICSIVVSFSRLF